MHRRPYIGGPRKSPAAGCSSNHGSRAASRARRKCHLGCLGTNLVSQGFAPISACWAEGAEPLKCLSGQLQGKLTCRKLSTERRSFSGV